MKLKNVPVEAGQPTVSTRVFERIHEYDDSLKKFFVSAPNPPIPDHLRKSLKHRLQINREDQEVSDHQPGMTTQSLGPPYQARPYPTSQLL